MNQPRSKPISVLVVDDEQPARQRLVDLLREDSQIEKIREAESGTEAAELILNERPDLVFLDVQMPELDGFGVIRLVGAELMPLTIFVTAHDRHAISAFEAGAVDYLLKPFSDERCLTAVTRAKTQLNRYNVQQLGQQVLHMVSKTAAPEGLWDRLVVKSGGITRFVRVVDIDWIEAAGVYVNLHVAGKELLYRSALHELAEKLDPMRFVRIHRSTIVNIESILQLESISHGEFEVVLKNGSRSRVSRNYRAELENRLGQTL